MDVCVLVQNNVFLELLNVKVYHSSVKFTPQKKKKLYHKIIIIDYIYNYTELLGRLNKFERKMSNFLLFRINLEKEST